MTWQLNNNNDTGEDRFREVVPDLHDQGDTYLLDKTHWPVGLDDLDLDDSLYTIEATAYALMQKLELGRRNETHAIANWLLKKRQLGGGFQSTQVTKWKLGVEGWVASRGADMTGPLGGAVHGSYCNFALCHSHSLSEPLTSGNSLNSYFIINAF